MSVTRNDQFGLPILRVSGELTNLTWPDFFAHLKNSVRGDCPRVAVDLSWVTRMGRSQALLLEDARRNLARKGITLSLVGHSPASIDAMGAASCLRRRCTGNRR